MQVVGLRVEHRENRLKWKQGFAVATPKKGQAGKENAKEEYAICRKVYKGSKVFHNFYYLISF